MRSSIAPAALLALVLAGCAGDAPTAPLPGGPVLDRGIAPQQAAPPRPIKGSCEAETVEVQPISRTVIRRVSVGTCQLSHLGRTGLHTVAYSDLVTLEQKAEHTYTAANGDLLYATSVGTGTLTPPATVHFVGVTTIIGGTGRFANATGLMNAEGTVNLITGDATFSYNGWIAY